MNYVWEVLNKACDFFEVGSPDELENNYEDVLAFATGYMYAQGKFTDVGSAEKFVSSFAEEEPMVGAEALWEKLQQEKLNAE